MPLSSSGDGPGASDGYSVGCFGGVLVPVGSSGRRPEWLVLEGTGISEGNS